MPFSLWDWILTFRDKVSGKALDLSWNFYHNKPYLMYRRMPLEETG